MRQEFSRLVVGVSRSCQSGDLSPSGAQTFDVVLELATRLYNSSSTPDASPDTPVSYPAWEPQSPTCQPLPTADAVSEKRITISGITDSPNNRPPDLRPLGSGKGHNLNELKVGEDACITQYCLHRPGMLIAQPFRVSGQGPLL